MPNANSSSPDVVDTLRGDHLTDKKYMILTCIHTSLNPNLDLTKLLETSEWDDIYYGSKDRARDPEAYSTVLESDENGAYVAFSQINEHNKFSKGYYNCTGVVAIGKDRESGENISFLVHQDPGYFLQDGEEKEKYRLVFEKLLIELRDRSLAGTIDIIILGGLDYTVSSKKFDLDEYRKGITIVDDIVSKIIGFHPTVVGGPLLIGGLKGIYQGKDIFLDTNNRRVYFKKVTKIIESNGHFAAHRVTEAVQSLIEN